MMKPKTGLLLLFSVIGTGLFALNSKVFPLGVDYHHAFHPVLKQWQQGRPIYTLNHEFYNPPWTLLIFEVLEWMGEKGGQAGLLLLTFAVLLQSWKLFSTAGYARAWSLAIICCNLHLVDLWLRGQLDGLVLAGVLLTYIGLRHQRAYVLGAGWTLALIRPTSIYLVGLYSIWLAYRQGKLWKALIIPLSTFLLSDNLNNLRDKGGPQPALWITTWWRIADYWNLNPIFPILIMLLLLAITLWGMQFQPNLETAFAYLTVASLITTPYALSYHYSTLMAIFIPVLLRRNVYLGIPLYLLTLTPVTRVIFGVGTAWIDIGLPLFAWLCFLYYLSRVQEHEKFVLEARPMFNI
jgi:hypothetical protein